MDRLADLVAVGEKCIHAKVQNDQDCNNQSYL